jgi:hypothetical protein
MKRAIVLALSVLFALTLAVPVAFGQSSGTSKAAGALGAAWWSWLVSTPESQNPSIGDYTFGPKCNGKPVTNTATKEWFLAGSPGNASEDGLTVIAGSGAERTCTVPADTELFFPIVNTLLTKEVDGPQGDAGPDATEQQILEGAKTQIDDFLKDGTYYAKVGRYDGTQLQDIPKTQIVRGASNPFPIYFYVDNAAPITANDNIFAP